MVSNGKKTDGLLFRFSMVFVVFTIVVLLFSGISTYINQTRIFQKEYEDKLKNIAGYMRGMIEREGEEFLWYVNYLTAHHDEIRMPVEFDDYIPAKREYERLFRSYYQDKVLGQDVSFDELPKEVKEAYVTYKQQYWDLTISNAAKDFGIAYCYFLVPTGEGLSVYYVIDVEHIPEEGSNPPYLHLCDVVEQPVPRFNTLWEAWNTGESPKGYDVIRNEFGNTYCYYMPAYAAGEKVGVIGVDIFIENVNQGILRNSLIQIVTLAIIMIAAIIIMMWFLNHLYIRKIEHLVASVRRYAKNKDVVIAADIEKDGHGKDEISALANQTAAMILELDEHMKNLVATTRELSETKLHADELHELANKDALTGIRNKTAYDSEIKKLEWEFEDGFTDFGFAMIDLNFLKRINDTYGHEQGNIAIKKLCRLVCSVFSHSPVFRIGGDEFVVILENDDLEHREELARRFEEELQRGQEDEMLEPWEQISAAIGYAVYDPVTDESVGNVFKRADKAMYQRKKEMKAVRT